MALDTIEAAIQDFQEGKMVIVIDEEDRENEGDLTMAAERSPLKTLTSWPNTAVGSSACR